MLSASGVATAGLAGLALVGCGDDDDDDDDTTPETTGTSEATEAPGTATVITTPEETEEAEGTATEAATQAETAQAGGVWRGYMAGDPTNLDPYVGTALPTHQTAAHVYSRLVRFKAGPGVDPGLYDVEGDLAESVETSDDGLTYTVTLRDNAMWHPPISRPVVAEDVAYSWRRYTGEEGIPAQPSAVTLQAYIAGVEAVDEKTVQITLSKPRGDFLRRENRFILIMPQETGTAFDPAQQLVGSGPWIFEEYQPGSLIRFSRNPDWHHGPDAPYFDSVEYSIVPEYATRFNQFLGGNIDVCDILGTDLSRAMDTLTDMQLYVGIASLPNSQIAFSPLDRPEESPWSDPRVRRAVSMAFERDQMTEAAYSVSEVQDLGIDVQPRWNNELPHFEQPYWLDPTGEYAFEGGDPTISDENKEAFTYSAENARAMLEAAGYPDGFDVDLFTTSARYGQAFNILSELAQQFLRDIGINAQLQDVDYNSVYITKIVVEKDFHGLLHIPRRTGIFSQLDGYYTPTGIANYSRWDDPELVTQIDEIYAQTDANEARKLMLSFQDYVNTNMYFVPMQLGAAGGYIGYAPNVRNALDYQVRGDDFGSEGLPYLWKAS
jgi:peptide/nickel transport system substrate-binding protein